MKIKIKKLHPQAKIPLKGTKDAACADVYATDIIKDSSNKITVKLGFSTEIPKGYKGIIVPRSSFTQKSWIMQNSPAQIDSDYRGEWMIKFEAIPVSIKNVKGVLFDNLYNQFPYKVGDRVAQIFFEKIINYHFVEVKKLVETERGSGGFGSTGVK
jgi:dUTP pyrophosphatase